MQLHRFLKYQKSFSRILSEWASKSSNVIRQRKLKPDVEEFPNGNEFPHTNIMTCKLFILSDSHLPTPSTNIYDIEIRTISYLSISQVGWSHSSITNIPKQNTHKSNTFTSNNYRVQSVESSETQTNGEIMKIKTWLLLAVTFMVFAVDLMEGTKVIFFNKKSKLDKGFILSTPQRVCPPCSFRDHRNKCRKAINFMKCEYWGGFIQ